MTIRTFAARLGPAALLLALAVAAGCGGPRTVTGTVSYKGKPLTRGQISFVGEGGKSASGTISADGTYVVPDAPAGDVTATVISYYVEGEAKLGFTPLKSAPSMKSAIPTKYNDPAKSGLRYTIDARTKTIDVELTD